MWVMGLIGAAWGATCSEVGFSDVVDIPPPAVLVLGERHGHQPDLGRAKRVVKRLKKSGPVTLALEAVHERYQPVLDRYASGKIDAAMLPSALAWTDNWTFEWGPYRQLVTAQKWGVKVRAVGHEDVGKPINREIPVPAGYADQLRPWTGEPPIPVNLEHSFVESMAWQSYHIVESAKSGWDGNGYLVLLVDRALVEGGLGVSWQAEHMLEPAVSSVVLAWAESPCLPGDQVWR